MYASTEPRSHRVQFTPSWADKKQFFDSVSNTRNRSIVRRGEKRKIKRKEKLKIEFSSLDEGRKGIKEFPLFIVSLFVIHAS